LRAATAAPGHHLCRRSRLPPPPAAAATTGCRCRRLLPSARRLLQPFVGVALAAARDTGGCLLSVLLPPDSGGRG